MTEKQALKWFSDQITQLNKRYNSNLTFNGYLKDSIEGEEHYWAFFMEINGTFEGEVISLFKVVPLRRFTENIERTNRYKAILDFVIKIEWNVLLKSITKIMYDLKKDEAYKKLDQELKDAKNDFEK